MDIIFDIDGTLADITHRRHYVATKPKNWAAFEKAAHLDVPNEPIVKLARILANAGHTILLCSGRGEQQREATEIWLQQHNIPFDDLYMRPAGDYRPDDVVKGELLDRIIADGYNVELVFDDRSRVVKLWRSRGLTCCQVAEGDF